MSGRKAAVWRGGLYVFGMVVLALGLTLNTEAGLGSSAIISVPYTISRGTGISLANLTLVLYCIFVAAQFVIKGRNRKLTDALQIVLSIVFTRFMALFKAALGYHSGNFGMDLATLIAGLVLTGIGAALTVDMRLVPNPGDGIVSCIADRTGKELGFTKNCVDLCSVAISLLLGCLFGAPLLGIGLGTILSMIGVGRVIAVFNHFAKKPLERLAGLG